MEQKNTKTQETQDTLMEELREKAKVDIRTVDANMLVDIADVKIDSSLPVNERISDYLRQIKNPYCFKSNGVIVKIGFTGKKKLEDCIKEAMFKE